MTYTLYRVESYFNRQQMHNIFWTNGVRALINDQTLFMPLSTLNPDKSDEPVKSII